MQCISVEDIRVNIHMFNINLYGCLKSNSISNCHIFNKWELMPVKVLAYLYYTTYIEHT